MVSCVEHPCLDVVLSAANIPEVCQDLLEHICVLGDQSLHVFQDKSPGPPNVDALDDVLDDVAPFVLHPVLGARQAERLARKAGLRMQKNKNYGTCSSWI